MHILIQTDEGQESREVADLEEAQALADSGLQVLVPNRDGGHRPLEESGVKVVYHGVIDGEHRFDVSLPKPQAPAAPVKQAAAKKAPVKTPAKTAKK